MRTLVSRDKFARTSSSVNEDAEPQRLIMLRGPSVGNRDAPLCGGRPGRANGPALHQCRRMPEVRRQRRASVPVPRHMLNSSAA